MHLFYNFVLEEIHSIMINFNLVYFDVEVVNSLQ